jgi:NAD(P)-dependent dehydrogenase (short-subunit alcohol dehydrogenase family)
MKNSIDHRGGVVFSREAFSGRVYGVTGGAHGIGLATARALAKLGARLLVIDIDAANLDRLETELQATDAEFQTAVVDVSDEPAMTIAIDSAIERWERLDGWVNCAFFAQRALAVNQAETDFVRAWEVNCLALWRTCRQIFPHLRLRSGSIVNISSVMAHQTMMQSGAYSSSKAAAEGLLRAIALEFARDHVRVNSVVPGYILTYEGLNGLATEPPDAWPAPAVTAREWMEYLTARSQPLPGPGMPEDVAQCILFLLSDAARFVTGATLTVDGGLSIDLRDVSDAARFEAATKFKQVLPALKALSELRQPVSK